MGNFLKNRDSSKKLKKYHRLKLAIHLKSWNQQVKKQILCGQTQNAIIKYIYLSICLLFQVQALKLGSSLSDRPPGIHDELLWNTPEFSKVTQGWAVREPQDELVTRKIKHMMSSGTFSLNPSLWRESNCRLGFLKPINKPSSEGLQVGEYIPRAGE